MTTSAPRSHDRERSAALQVTATVLHDREKPGLRLTLSGSLAFGTTDPLISTVAHHLAEPDAAGRVELHCRDVDVCDSHGISQLLRIKAMAAERAAALVVVDPSPSMRRTLHLTGVQRFLAVTSAAPPGPAPDR